MVVWNLLLQFDRDFNRPDWLRQQQALEGTGGKTLKPAVVSAAQVSSTFIEDKL
jgi:hypothetical protein